MAMVMLVLLSSHDSLRCLVVSDAPEAHLSQLGLRITGRAGQVYTAWVDPDKMEQIRASGVVRYIEEAHRVFPVNDLASAWSAVFTVFAPDTVDFTCSGPDSLQIIAGYDPDSDLDPEIALYDDSWSLIARDQDGAWGKAARAELRLPGSGTYHLVVSAQSGSGSAMVYMLADAVLGVQGLHLSSGAWPQHRAGWTGKGVLMGFVDSGIDWQHQDFWAGPNDTRILYIWDQTLTPQAGESSPSGFGYGVEYDSLDIIAGTPREIDDMGHGTHVAGTAAGNGRATNGVEPAGRYSGQAPETQIVVVKTAWTDADVIDGVNYVFQKAQALGMACVVNLSLGHHDGPHDGTSPFEQALASLTGPGRIIAAAAGNSGYDSVHARLVIADQDTLSFGAFSPVFHARFWHDSSDSYLMCFLPPESTSLQDWFYWPDSGLWATGYPDPSDDYQDNLSCALVCPGLDLSQAQNPFLVIRHRFAMGQGDGGIVEMSTDSLVWEAIAPRRGYPDSTGFEPAFSGTSPSYILDTFDLVQDTVWIRFRMFSDPSGTGPGWFLDSMCVQSDGGTEFAEGFSSGSGGLWAEPVNALWARPGTAPACWVGSGASQGGGYVKVDYQKDPYPGNGCSYGSWQCYGQSNPTSYNWTVVLQRTRASGTGQWDAWRVSAPGGYRRFIRGATLGGTLIEPACSPSLLTVGGYTGRTAWEDSTGTVWDYLYPQVGQIGVYSSKGPTRDNRIKPDITAKRIAISSMSSQASFASWAVAPDQRHALMHGTSMAAPQAAGAIALYLQARPFADPNEIISTFRAWASQDSITGYAPDTVWGWGRLCLPDTGFTSTREKAKAGQRLWIRACPSVAKRPVISYSVPAGEFQVLLFDLAGRRVELLERGQGPCVGEIQVQQTKPGVYIAVLKTHYRLHTTKLVVR